MKKIYRMKEPLSAYIDALYGDGVSAIIARAFSQPHDRTVVRRQLYRRNSPACLDTISFTADDFEIKSVYDENGWNVFPDTVPNFNGKGEYFLMINEGGVPEVIQWIEDGFYYNCSENVDPLTPFVYKLINNPSIEELRGE